MATASAESIAKALTSGDFNPFAQAAASAQAAAGATGEGGRPLGAGGWVLAGGMGAGGSGMMEGGVALGTGLRVGSCERAAAGMLSKLSKLCGCWAADVVSVSAAAAVCRGRCPGCFQGGF